MKPGDVVEYWKNGWRIGHYVRTIERGRKFGMIKIRINGGSKERDFEPDHVKPVEPPAEPEPIKRKVTRW